MSQLRHRLLREFRNADPEYRNVYAEGFLNSSIAAQIKVLREERGLTQGELAGKIGTKQAGISRLENANYSAWKTETLRKIARALDVRLKITFETFGSLIDEAENFNRRSLRRPEPQNDQDLQDEARSTQTVAPLAASEHSASKQNDAERLGQLISQANALRGASEQVYKLAPIPIDSSPLYAAKNAMDAGISLEQERKSPSREAVAAALRRSKAQ